MFCLPMGKMTHEIITLWYRPPDVLLGSKDYMTTIDMWSIGCIFAEMVTGKALFTGLNETDQTKKIFKIIGTPSEEYFPNLKKLSGWSEEFDKFPGQNIKQYVPSLENDGYDLLISMLQANPDKRITTEDALNHSYFNEIKDSIIKEIYNK